MKKTKLTGRFEKIEVVNTSDEKRFVENINGYLSEGWEIISANVGFVNSSAYDFCGSYMAILGIRQEEAACTHEITDRGYNCAACGCNILPKFPETY